MAVRDIASFRGLCDMVNALNLQKLRKYARMAQVAGTANGKDYQELTGRLIMTFPPFRLSFMLRYIL